MIVLGLTGKIGCGKDTISRYLKKEHGFKSVSMGNMVRKYTKEEGFEMTRENQQEIATRYREERGKDFFARKVVEKIDNLDGERFVINGVRSPEDVKVSRERFGEDFLLVRINSSATERFRRAKGRSRPGDPDVLEDFKRQEESDIEKFNQKETFRMVDYTIDNDTSLSDLFSKIDDLVEKLEQDVEEN